MKIYVAGHCQYACRYIAGNLATAGHQITSSWLDPHSMFMPNSLDTHSETERATTAENDILEVLDSDALVLFNIGEVGPGGKHVEVGAALGAGKLVFVLGEQTNMMLWHPLVSSYSSLEALMRGLSAVRHDVMV